MLPGHAAENATSSQRGCLVLLFPPNLHYTLKIQNQSDESNTTNSWSDRIFQDAWAPHLAPRPRRWIRRSRRAGRSRRPLRGGLSAARRGGPRRAKSSAAGRKKASTVGRADSRPTLNFARPVSSFSSFFQVQKARGFDFFQRGEAKG